MNTTATTRLVPSEEGVADGFDSTVTSTRCAPNPVKVSVVVR